MKISLIAVGRMKSSPEKDMVDRYIKRLPWPVIVTEVEGRTQDDEAEALLAKIPDQSAVIALDERGKTLSSDAFAKKLDTWMLDGRSSLACVIGGADGLTDAVRDRADLVMAFGPATWPHMLVRAMLLEQLYRAQTIISGHPYHRS